MILNKIYKIHYKCDKMKKKLNDKFIYSLFQQCEKIL